MERNYPGLTSEEVTDIRAGRMKDPRFFPCNKREAHILDTLTGDQLHDYKTARHSGDTVRGACERVGFPYPSEVPQ